MADDFVVGLNAVNLKRGNLGSSIARNRRETVEARQLGSFDWSQAIQKMRKSA
jgi:hypothetical protein